MPAWGVVGVGHLHTRQDLGLSFETARAHGKMGNCSGSQPFSMHLFEMFRSDSAPR